MQEQAELSSSWRDRLAASEQRAAEATKAHSNADASHATALAGWQQRCALLITQPVPKWHAGL